MTEADRRVARLSELVGWHTPADLHVDWEFLAAELGHRFPADYRRYVESFPPGDIGPLHVLHPAEPGEYVETIRRQQEFLDEDAASIVDFPHRFGSGPGDLTIWGAVQADFLLCWQLTGDDPEAWPTVVVETPNLSAGTVQRYDGSAVSLLIDIAEGRNPVPLIGYITEVLPFTFGLAGEPL
jgi:hypothetical protein